MTGAEFQKALVALGLTDATAGQFLGTHPITVWRWHKTGPPLVVARLLRLMLRRGISVIKAEEQTAAPYWARQTKIRI